MTWFVLLGLGAAVCWGVSDFLGGLQARSQSALGVALWSQLAGLTALSGVLLIQATPPLLESVAWGLGAGLFGGLGLLLLYRRLATGMMALIAPVSACGVLVPVLVALTLGGSLNVLVSVGIPAALAGIVLVSLAPSPDHQASGDLRTPMLLALGAALCFGMVYVFVDRGAIRGDASPLWVIGGERLASVALLLAFAVCRKDVRLPNAHHGRITTVGLLDTAANVLFAFATRHGNLGVVSMLASTFPVVTVLLGWFVLGERLTRLQQGGVLLALVGVALLSSG